ncbi:MAG: hypothetical protein PHW28_03475 [Mesotoga sp.]|nr:hypothetical protein [Mesotoga sp.]
MNKLHNYFNVLRTPSAQAIALVVLTFLMMISVAIYNYNKCGNDDFFNHAAVVNELKHNILHPKHPYWGTDEATVYFTPYNVGLALFARITDLSAVDTMFVFSLINTFMFFLCLYLFIKAYKKSFSILIPFVLLFLWGYKLSFIFYSFRVFPGGASYHLMFSLWMILLSFYICLKAPKYYYVLLPFISTIAIISQPITIFFSIFGILIMLWKRYDSLVKSFKIYIFYGIALIILLYLWPYYSFFNIVKSTSTNLTSWVELFPLYNPLVIVKLIWPFIVILLFIWKGFWNENKHLLILATILLIPYLLFAPKNSELIARGMTYILFIFQIAVALSLSDKIKERRKISFLIMFFTSIIMLYNIAYGLNSIMKRDNSWIREIKEEVQIAARHIEHYDIVITDKQTAYYMLGYSGKVLATVFDQRINKEGRDAVDDLKIIYDLKTTNEERKKIMTNYGAKYILLNKDKYRLEPGFIFTNTQPELISEFRNLGNTIIEMDNLILIQLN